MAARAEILMSVKGATVAQADLSRTSTAVDRLSTSVGKSETVTGRARKGLQRFSGGLLGMAKSAAGAVVGLMAVDKVISGIGTAVNTAADTGEEVSKNAALFGRHTVMVNRFAAASAKGLGVSRLAALQATGVFGGLLRPLGISEKMAAGMSVRMVRLAADMASFNNASPEEALDALRSGLSGESEPLRRFGVTINDAALKQQALTMGLIKHGQQLTPATKAQATYALILKQTALQQGDATKTGGELAGQKRRLSAQVSDLAGTIGVALIPAMTRLVSFANERVIPTVSAVWKWLKRNQKTVTVVASALGILGTALLVFKLVQSLTAAVLALNVAMRANPVGLVIALIAGLAVGLVIAYRRSATFRAAVDKLWAAAKIGFGGMRDAWKWVTSAAKKAWDIIGPIIRNIIKGFEKIASLMPGQAPTLSAGQLALGVQGAGATATLNSGISTTTGALRQMPAVPQSAPRRKISQQELGSHGGGGGTTTIVVPVHLDGRLVAESTVQHVARKAARR